MPYLRKAELVEGIVHIPAPPKVEGHSIPLGRLVTWLGNYMAVVKSTDAGTNATVILDNDNELQPDAFLRIQPGQGGQSRTTADDFVEGAPEMTAEVASSSASYDLHAKKNAYRRNGVREYLVWITRESRLVWWHLVGGEYVEIQPDESGVMRSRVVPGRWLDAPAMLRGDLGTVLEKLREGLATPEAMAFRG